MLEIELVKSKQDLGEALNAVYEYEQTAADRELMSQIECNMTFKEGRVGKEHLSARGDTNESGDNLSNSSNSQRKNEAA